MTNLEFYKDEIVDLLRRGHALGCATCMLMNRKAEEPFSCHFVCEKEKVVDWLLKEHKEPIKLKQWEYDLIRANEMSHDFRFKAFRTYRNMKAMGYFEGLTDLSMTLKEILDNCEVVDD